MVRFLTGGATIAAILCSAAFAGAQSTPGPDKMDSMGSSMKSMGSSMKAMSGTGMSHTFKLHAQNGSGESGTAMLMQSGDSLSVKLALSGAQGAQPAHIHKGTCANLNPKPLYPLTTLSDGTSSTSLKGVKLSELTAGKYAINVHKSTTDIKDYVACGDLTIASAK